MAKYNELVKEYKDIIASIKDRQAEYDTLVAQADAIDPVLHPEPDVDAIDRMQGLYEQSEEVYNVLMCLWSELDQDIQAEYAAVPFAAPRNAGIAGFYNEAELN